MDICSTFAGLFNWLWHYLGSVPNFVLFSSGKCLKIEPFCVCVCVCVCVYIYMNISKIDSIFFKHIILVFFGLFFRDISIDICREPCRHSTSTLADIWIDICISPPKDGEIALWSATNCWYVVKCVSPKWNQSNNKIQWYNILVTFISKFNCRQYETKIYVFSNLSKDQFTTWQY